MRSVKARLLAALGGLLLCVVALATSGWWASRTADGGLQSIYGDRVIALRDLKVVSDMYAVNIVDASHKVRNGNVGWAEGSKSVEQARELIGKHWSAYLATFMDESEKPLIAQAEKVRGAADQAVAELDAALRGQDKAALDRFVAERLYQTIDPLTEAIGKLVDTQLEGAVATYDSTHSAFVTAQIINGAAVLAAAAALAFALWTTLAGLVRPLGALTTTMGDLAAGGLDVVVTGTDRPDELGAMAKAVQVFKQAAEENARMSRDRTAMEAGRTERGARVDALIQNFEQVSGGALDGLARTSSSLNEAATAMVALASQTGEHAAATGLAAEATSSNVQTVASATEQLSAAANEIGGQVAASARISGEAVAGVERTNAAVQLLLGNTQRVSEVVALISAIAEQTNLLALNATIEAARAGEAGRGFAVVALEVKQLAGQTAKATGEITSQVAAIQEGTRNAATAMQEVGATIERVSAAANAIAAAVEEQQASTGEITRSAVDAARGTSQVTRSIGQVSEIATQADAVAAQVATAGRALLGDADNLQHEIRAFLQQVRAA